MIPRFPSRARKKRRGTIYVITLTTTLIVLALGTAALSTARIQRQQAIEAYSLRQAQLHAESALQVAYYRIRTDASYRAKLVSNAWGTDQAIGDGFYSFTGTDPNDGDLMNGAFDPVVITAIGKEGGATYRLAARYEFEQRGISSLQSGIHANTDLTFTSATANSTAAPFSSNTQIKPKDGCQIYGDCIAAGVVDTITTAQIYGTTTNYALPREVPNGSTVLSHYQGLGTTIMATALPLWDREYLENPGAETGVIAPWVASNCTAAVTAVEKYAGTYSFHVSNRALLGDGVLKQDITSQVAQNVRYQVRGAVLDKNALAVDNYRLTIQIQTSTGTVLFTSGWYVPYYNIWQPMSFTPTLTWSGTLIKAEVFVQTSLGLLPFHADDISVKEADAKSSTYVIHRKLLSPQRNPFTGVLNSQGIYVLNCAGNKINIRDSRIVGTLVVLNPGNGSTVEKSVCWESAAYQNLNPSSPNLPALIVSDAKFELGLDPGPLNEATANMNFNPSGSSYDGVTDSDLLDSYPSQITGIVYSTSDLTLSKYSTIHGQVIAAQKIDILGDSPTASSVTVKHEPVYYYLNPPIGFRTTPKVKLVSGSVEKQVQ